VRRGEGRLRIAILGSRGYPSTYGGFETFVRRLAPWLVERGHEVTVYGRGSRHRSVSVVDGVRVVETRGVDRKAAGTPTHGFTAAIDCLRHRPDVVLALNVANGPSLPLLRAARIPVVVNVDGLEWERGKWGPGGRAAFKLGARLSARFASALVADSREIRRFWTREFGVTPAFIPYGADVIEGVPSDRVAALGVEPGGYALAVARLVPENNVELFLDALEAAGWPVPAVVVGEANYANPLGIRLQSLTASGRILWLGHVADQDLLTQLWSHAGAYFHGHSVGGTNPSLLQALGCGAPVVAIDTPFNREVLGEEGRLVEAGAATVAAQLKVLLADDAERRSAAALGRQIIQARYSWDEVLLAYETLLLASV
jgi:glycosyltransferase involved in cell wall biosynthesis